MSPPEITLYIEILETIKKAAEEPGRHPTRYGIIAELCEKFCYPLLAELKKYAIACGDHDSETYQTRRRKIVEDSKKHMNALEEAFGKLLDPPPKIELKRSGEVKLTDEGGKCLEPLYKKANSPA